MFELFPFLDLCLTLIALRCLFVESLHVWKIYDLSSQCNKLINESNGLIVYVAKEADPAYKQSRTREGMYIEKSLIMFFKMMVENVFTQ